MISMEYSLYVLLGMAWFADIYFYGMQRYVQLISREVEISFKVGKQLMLPMFYGINFLLTIIKYGLGIYLVVYYEWIMVLYIIAPIFIIQLFVPIPYSFLYKRIINRSLSNKMAVFPEHISTIIKIQVNSNLLH
jgi:hypothetical protein